MQSYNVMYRLFIALHGSAVVVERLLLHALSIIYSKRAGMANG